MGQFNIQINPYLELINSILMTSRYNEITKPLIGYGLISEEINNYTSSIKKLLENFSTNPIYPFIESMIPNGFTFSRPVELALSLSDSGDFTLQFPLSKLCIEYCGGIAKINTLLKQLKVFSEQVRYMDFFKKEVLPYYSPIIEKVKRDTELYPFLSILEEEYGKKQNSYNFVFSSLMKGNFGIHFINAKTLMADIFSVFATDDFSLSPAILFHEYSHPFINPLTEKYFDIVKKYQNSYLLLKPYKLSGYLSGYGDWEECVNEHFVRAMSIHLLKKCKLNDLADKLLHNDLYRGYKYIPMILERYDFYDKNRHIYDDFEKYYPELLNVFLNNI